MRCAAGNTIVLSPDDVVARINDRIAVEIGIKRRDAEKIQDLPHRGLALAGTGHRLERKAEHDDAALAAGALLLDRRGAACAGAVSQSGNGAGLGRDHVRSGDVIQLTIELRER